MFCPKCGKSHEDLIEGLCKSCFIEELSIIEIPNEIEVVICAHCGSTLNEGKWKDQGLTEEEILYESILGHIQVNEYVENIEIWVEELLVKGSNIECLVHAKGNVLGEVIEQEYNLNIKLKRDVCPECSKRASGYYEAVIQIRAHERFPTKDEIKKVDQLLSKNINKISKHNKMAYVTDRIELREGIDYYIGSYKVAKKLVNAIRDVFGGVVIESPRLMGKDKSTGKELYRIWISLRLPRFKKGDFIKSGGNLGQLIAIDGRKIQFKDLKTGEPTSVSWRDYEKIEFSAKKEDIKKTTLTAKTPESIQILDPDDYQPVEIDKTPENQDISIGEEVPVIKINEIIYIVSNSK
ncbi:MAG: 60S ribosomal export protein NMD3 [Methanomicrobiales archaeon]